MSNQSKQPKEISATDARNNFADIVNEVYYSGQEYLITRHDEPMVKLVRADAAVKAADTLDAAAEQPSTKKETETTQSEQQPEETKGVQQGEKSAQPEQAKETQPQQPAQAQPHEPQRPKKIELDTDQFKRPAGLRKPGEEAQPDEETATEETAAEEPEKDISEEEERLARIKARILKIYKG